MAADRRAANHRRLGVAALERYLPEIASAIRETCVASAKASQGSGGGSYYGGGAYGGGVPGFNLNLGGGGARGGDGKNRTAAGRSGSSFLEPGAAEALLCVGALASSCGELWEPHARALLPALFAPGLTAPLVDALDAVAVALPATLPMIQRRLIETISGILAPIHHARAGGGVGGSGPHGRDARRGGFYSYASGGAGRVRPEPLPRRRRRIRRRRFRRRLDARLQRRPPPRRAAEIADAQHDRGFRPGGRRHAPARRQRHLRPLGLGRRRGGVLRVGFFSRPRAERRGVRGQLRGRIPCRTASSASAARTTSRTPPARSGRSGRRRGPRSGGETSTAPRVTLRVPLRTRRRSGRGPPAARRGMGPGPTRAAGTRRGPPGLFTAPTRTDPRAAGSRANRVFRATDRHIFPARAQGPPRARGPPAVLRWTRARGGRGGDGSAWRFAPSARSRSSRRRSWVSSAGTSWSTSGTTTRRRGARRR